jgi:hypothetical protein
MKSLAIRPFVGTGLLLLVPLVMSVMDRDKPAGDGWHWDAADFLVMGARLFGAGLSYEFLARRLGRKAQRAGLGILILGLALAVWIELAVGGISQFLRFVAGANP